MSAVRVLYGKTYGAHVGWAADIAGNYLACPASGTASDLAYHGYLTYVEAFNQGISPGAYRRQIVSIVRADGWRLTPARRDVPPGGPWTSHYDMVKGSLTGDAAFAGTTALLRFSSPCFDAGPAARGLATRGDELPLPHPARTPPPASAPRPPTGS